MMIRTTSRVLMMTKWQRLSRGRSFWCLPETSVRDYHGTSTLWRTAVAQPRDLHDDNTPTGSISSEQQQQQENEEDTLGRGDGGGKFRSPNK